MNNPAPLPKPPPLANRWVRALLSLFVAVPLGLAPYLGLSKIPGFKALIGLYPEQLRDASLILATFAMGMIAVAVQFFGEDHINRERLRLAFMGVFVALMVALVALGWEYTTHVVRMTTGTEGDTASLIVADDRRSTCPCKAEDGDPMCIKRLGLEQENLSACWKDRDVRSIGFSLIVLYVFLIAAAGALVGLLVLRPATKT